MFVRVIDPSAMVISSFDVEANESIRLLLWMSLGSASQNLGSLVGFFAVFGR
jgi:hypothetical protein